jgi:hypothetical protein
MQHASLVPIDKAKSNVSNGLAKLVLTLLETLKELMERQARRRMKEGSLSEVETEKLGIAFMQLNEKIGEIASLFSLQRKDLTLTLFPFVDQQQGASSIADSVSPKGILSLVDLLDRVVEKGVVVFGDLGLSVADVELINVQLRLVVNAVKNREERPYRTHNRRGRKNKIAKHVENI